MLLQQVLHRYYFLSEQRLVCYFPYNFIVGTFVCVEGDLIWFLVLGEARP